MKICPQNQSLTNGCNNSTSIGSRTIDYQNDPNNRLTVESCRHFLMTP